METKDKAAAGADALLERFARMKREEKMDLSSGEDLSVAIMNLVSIEEHLFFTGAKTGEDRYLDMLKEARAIRIALLKRLVKDPEGEEWCISKHLLASTYRVMEVGTKELSLGRKDEAKALFDKAFSLYSMFWGIALKEVPAAKPEAMPHAEKPVGIMGRMRIVARKAIDCCIE
jgi:hypothetical protein